MPRDSSPTVRAPSWPHRPRRTRGARSCADSWLNCHRPRRRRARAASRRRGVAVDRVGLAERRLQLLAEVGHQGARMVSVATYCGQALADSSGSPPVAISTSTPSPEQRSQRVRNQTLSQRVADSVTHRRRLAPGQRKAQFSQSQYLNSPVWARSVTSRSVLADQPAIVRFASFTDTGCIMAAATSAAPPPA
jgi:hypothetical protein